MKDKNPLDKNPLTGVEFSEDYHRIWDSLSKLPAAQDRVQKDLKKKYDKSDVLIAKMATGTGKSVIIAPSLLKFSDYKDRIVVTQPRSLNTEVAKFIAQSLDSPTIGRHVGYKYRFNDYANDETLLTFMTDGMLVNFFYNDPTLSKYDVVVVDELHERNVNIDIILTLCKKLMTSEKLMTARGKPLKLVLMSATIDPKMYSDYFASLKPEIIEVEGVSYPIERHYLDELDESDENYLDIVKSQVVHAIRDLKKNPETANGDILVFLPSATEIREMIKWSANISELPDEAIYAIGLYRGINEKTKDIAQSESLYKNEVVNKSGATLQPTRKIVYATNIAESGITINGIRAVVDSGRRYESLHDSAKNTKILHNVFVSQGEIMQRIGRAGRTAPGSAYHCYTEKQWDSFDADKKPEILTQRIENIIVSLMHGPSMEKPEVVNLLAKVTDLLEFLKQMPAPPGKEQVEYALKNLVQLKLIDPDSGLTTLGHCVADIPLDPEYALVLLAAKDSRETLESVKQIISMMSIETNIGKWFTEPPKDSPVYKKFRKKYDKLTNARADVLAFKKIYENYNRKHSSVAKRGGPRDALKKWAYEEFLQLNQLDKVKKILMQLNRAVDKADKDCRVDSVVDDDSVIAAFMQGFSMNIATLVSGNLYEYVAPDGTKIKVECRPGYGNNLSKLNKNIMFIELADILGTKKFNGIFNLTSTHIS